MIFVSIIIGIDHLSSEQNIDIEFIFSHSDLP